MGGPWKDRSYTPSVPAGVEPNPGQGTKWNNRPRSAWVEAGDDVNYLAAYAVGLILGSVLTVMLSPLWLRWLPFVQP